MPPAEFSFRSSEFHDIVHELKMRLIPGTAQIDLKLEYSEEKKKLLLYYLDPEEGEWMPSTASDGVHQFLVPAFEDGRAQEDLLTRLLVSWAGISKAPAVWTSPGPNGETTASWTADEFEPDPGYARYDISYRFGGSDVFFGSPPDTIGYTLSVSHGGTTQSVELLFTKAASTTASADMPVIPLTNDEPEPSPVGIPDDFATRGRGSEPDYDFVSAVLQMVQMKQTVSMRADRALLNALGRAKKALIRSRGKGT